MAFAQGKYERLRIHRYETCPASLSYRTIRLVGTGPYACSARRRLHRQPMRHNMNESVLSATRVGGSNILLLANRFSAMAEDGHFIRPAGGSGDGIGKAVR